MKRIAYPQILLIAALFVAGCNNNNDYPNTSCEAGYHAFGNECELDSAEHCGSHEITCGSEQVCSGGNCQNSCGNGQSLCGTTCINLDNNVSFCGACDNDCNANKPEHANNIACIARECKTLGCEADYHLNGNDCELDSAEHCGSHDIACGSEQVCSGGKCQDSCGNSQSLCGTTCINLDNNVSFCGACDNDCNANKPDHANNIACIARECKTLGCEAGYHLNGNACELDSAEHCGSHDAACGSEQVCFGGQCEDNCGNGQSLCGTTCINLNNNVEFCGACDNNCNTNKPEHANNVACIARECKTLGCESGYHLNGNDCEEDTVDNCGEHGRICSDVVSGFDEGSCYKGDCILMKCDEGKHIHEPNLHEYICEADSTEHCGMHEYACQDHVDGWTDGSCDAGKCVSTACGTGFHLYQSTCEADSDDHCGENRVACTQNMTCIEGSCQCSEGFTKCDDACVDLKKDNNHCGQCDNPCSTRLSCDFGKCLSTSVRCNNINVNLYNDLEHCGACNNKCADGLTCVSAECVPEQGSMFCDNNLIDSRIDSAHCGECHKACQVGYQCVDSKCQIMEHPETEIIKCNGMDTTVSANTNHCGGCNHVCSTTDTCLNSKCIPGPIAGQKFKFGHYEQDNNISNGKEDIYWHVLKIDPVQKCNNDLMDCSYTGEYIAVMISEKVLDAIPFGLSLGNEIDWAQSSIRSWLNGYKATENAFNKDYSDNNFINTAFTAQEQTKLIQYYVTPDEDDYHTADPNTHTMTKQGALVSDRIFLLSSIEVSGYLRANMSLRKAVATPYAKAQGVNVDSSDITSYWLRTMGSNQENAMIIDQKGEMVTTFDNASPKLHENVITGNIGLRPVIRVYVNNPNL